MVNIGLYLYGGGFKGIPGLLGGSVEVLGARLSQSRLVAFAVAIGASLGILLFLKKSLFGRAIRAVARRRTWPRSPASRSSACATRPSRSAPRWPGWRAC